jgi:stress response protein YsnF
MLQNPKIMALFQTTPQGQAIVAAMMAHINEHLAFAYRKEVEASIGLLLPTEEQEKNMTPEVAAQVAQLSAQASVRITQQAQAQAAQQKTQQQAQDPIVQMQQQELQIKMEELKLKQQKQQADEMAKAAQIEVEQARIAAQKEIASMQVGANAAAAKDKLQKQQFFEGSKLGVDIAKHRAQMAAQMAASKASQKPVNKG